MVLLPPACYIWCVEVITHAYTFTIRLQVCLVIAAYARPEQGQMPRGRIKTHPESIYDIFAVIPAICFGYQVRLKLEMSWSAYNVAACPGECSLWTMCLYAK